MTKITDQEVSAHQTAYLKAQFDADDANVPSSLWPDLQVRAAIAAVDAVRKRENAVDITVDELIRAASALVVKPDGRSYFESGEDTARFRKALAAALNPEHVSAVLPATPVAEDVYELRTIADLLKVPTESRSACLRQIQYALELHELAHGEDAQSVGIDVLVWKDDDVKDVQLQDVTGETFLTLEVRDDMSG